MASEAVTHEFKVEKIKESWSGYAKDWAAQVSALEVDGWRVLNLQQGGRSWEITVWMVRP